MIFHLLNQDSLSTIHKKQQEGISLQDAIKQTICLEDNAKLLESILTLTPQILIEQSGFDFSETKIHFPELIDAANIWINMIRRNFRGTRSWKCVCLGLIFN